MLQGVDFDVREGEIHVLAGENGAGKSTLIKILSGVYQDYSGDVELDGVARRFSGPPAAARAGVSTIHQELALVPTMSVADNLFLGRERTGRMGGVDSTGQRADARTVLQAARIDVDPDTPVGTLPVPVQQTLEIARALSGRLRLLILDEPTSALDERDVTLLFERLLALRDDGCAIVYITHKMAEIYRLADRITVLRDGRTVGTAEATELSQDELVSWMVGRVVRESEGPHEVPPHAAEPVLSVRDLTVRHPTIPDRHVVDGVSFAVGHGEIVGLAGLQGCGASEVLHATFGAITGRATGKWLLRGSDFRPVSPGDSIGRGVVLLTNDRKTLGLAPDLSVTRNTTLASLPRFAGPAGWLDQQAEDAAARAVGERFALAAPSYDAPVRTLSGGNQQKVYLARCLLAQPRVLLLDEPTRGIDVAAKADIYEMLRGWAAEGIGIVLITSELSELLTLADRVLVMHRGRITTELPRGTATKEGVLAAAMGATDGRGAA